MNLYEIYYINLWKPPLNVDDKARDDLSISMPDKEWVEFIPANWDSWPAVPPALSVGHRSWRQNPPCPCQYLAAFSC